MDLETLEAIFYYHLGNLCENLINKDDGPVKQVDHRQHHLLWYSNVK